MKVALKFCGGCNPDYERVEYFSAISRAAGDRLHWRRLEDRDYQAVLLICGCPTACPLNDMPAGLSLVCLTSPATAPETVVTLLGERE